MSKWFEMKVETWQVVLVEVEDTEGEEEAMTAAHDEFMGGKDGQITDAIEIADDNLASAKRNADEVLPLD
ncbi:MULTISPECIES: hypothetical protein [unclassified Caballeronia]|uniref:hypothetical protein n=1 Tax=unclassified Caballeronia TaxID=2646786 RepID=UPI0028598CB8|nr:MULTISPECIES: hypothetical protein [unclassified Caballeronia]MDR5776247.1 hypothetical protein [Caballeronia sp. LZ002]MDR5801166.1 hypothetical protein [Caballeronia sp. LZ001]MDR5851687.1 hypothetical protein [Caballeronia sp. LZ003]